MAALQEFGIIFALTKGGPGDTLMSLSVTAYTPRLPSSEVLRRAYRSS